MEPLNTPVAFIVFNRPDTTREVFAAIAAARPSHLFLIADGPRADRTGETERCRQVRQIVTAVDWPCKVETNFAEENMGCRRRVISGLNWVFSIVEQAIILEDDCLPDPSFFPFCSELLERYKDNHQVGIISGFNAVEKKLPVSESYFFSVIISIWGWATWRRAWNKYDEHLRSWPEAKSDGLLQKLFADPDAVAFWTRTFDAMYNGTGPDTWDFQWVYTCWLNHSVSIVPRRNLVRNIGLRPDATHTTFNDPDLTIASEPMAFPLRHPTAVSVNRRHAELVHSHFHTPGLLRRIRRKLIRLYASA